MLGRVDEAVRRLVLMRHAKSDWSTELADHGRPLAARGQRDAPAAGRWLNDNVGPIDMVVCSTATRARQTWELAAAALDTEPEVRHEERVYDASAGELLALVHELPDSVHTVALVGHNPGMEQLASLLAGESLPFRTPTLAVVSWSGAWADAGPAVAAVEGHTTPRG